MHLLASTANLCRSAYIAVMNVQKPPQIGPLNNGAMLAWLVWFADDAILHHPLGVRKNRDGAEEAAYRRMSCVASKMGCVFFFDVYFCKFWGNIFYNEKPGSGYWVGEHTQNVMNWTSLMVNRSAMKVWVVWSLGVIRPAAMLSKNLPNPPKNDIEYACCIHIELYIYIYM